MRRNLPDFDTMKRMAEEKPEQLEQLRQELAEDIYQQAPAEQRRQLRGLQFKIDMAMRLEKNQMARCVKISAMMHDSFAQLNTYLNTLGEIPSSSTINRIYDKARFRQAQNPKPPNRGAQILPFRKKSPT